MQHLQPTLPDGGRPLQALDGGGLTDCTVFDGAEEGEEFIELDLPDADVVQEMLRENPELLGRFDQPLQHRIRVHLEDPCGAPDT